jgi:tRNA nucleotidyltransferase/poly(A) polymerase
LLALPDEWETPVFPLKGEDLLALGMQPGPQVGAVLRAVEQRWIDGDFTSNRETLLGWAKEMIAAD